MLFSGIKNKRNWIFAAHLLALILYHAFAYIGHYGYDDLQYAKLSYQLTQGFFDINDHFSYRFSILLFTTISYLTFGVSDFASAFPAMLFSSFCLYLVYRVLRKEELGILSIGLSLCLFSNWYIFYSDKLMPDIYVAFSMMWSVYIIYQSRYVNSSKPFMHSFLLSLALFLGFISKGTIIFIIPLILYLFIWDFWYRKRFRFWFYFFLNGSLILGLYFVLIYLLTGDAGQRFEAMSSNAYLNLCSYSDQPFGMLIERIGYGFFNYMTAHGMLVSYIFLLGFLFQRKLLHYLKLKDTFSFFYVSALLLLLSSNFMSISLKAYSPMCLDPRHFLFLSPVAAIPAAFVIASFINEGKLKLQFLLSLLLFSLLTYYLAAKSLFYLYLPLLLLFLLYSLARRKVHLNSAFILIFTLVLMLLPLDMFKYAQIIDYRGQVDVLKEQVLASEEKSYIISDPIQSRLAYYYSGFDSSRHEFLSYGLFHRDSLDSRKKLLYINPYTQMKAFLDEQDLPYYARYIDSQHELLFEDTSLNIQLYHLKQLSLPMEDSEKLLVSLNDFERTYRYWKQNPDDLIAGFSYDGKYSSKIAEYSSTFVYPLDSLNKLSNLLIATSLQLNFSEESSAMLVLSLEDEEGRSHLWKSVPINKYIKAYSHWWEVQYSLKVTQPELENVSLLKVYIWNQKGDEAWLDNFEVQLLILKD